MIALRYESQTLSLADIARPEADGELLATIPIEVTMVPSALTVLVPQTLATEKVRDHLMATAAPPMPRPVS